MLEKLYAKMNSESAACVIKHMKSIFARHGIPQEVVSNNEPQYSSCEFSKFDEEYGFVYTALVVSSTLNPMEKLREGVQTVKSLLKKTENQDDTWPYWYIHYLFQDIASLAKLLMDRKLQTT